MSTAKKRAARRQGGETAWCLSSIRVWDWLTRTSLASLSASLCLLQDEWCNCFWGDISMFNQKANMCIIALLVFKPFSHYRHRSCLKALLQMFGSVMTRADPFVSPGSFPLCCCQRENIFIQVNCRMLKSTSLHETYIFLKKHHVKSCYSKILIFSMDWNGRDAAFLASWYGRRGEMF